MVRTQRRPGWLSLPEAAQAVQISLPGLRYLARRLALPLGVSLDDRGHAYIPAGKLELLRQVAAYRSQGYTVDQIDGLLRAPGPEPRHQPPLSPAELERTQELAAPGPSTGSPGSAPPPSSHQPGDLSLPFPFPEADHPPRSGERHPLASEPREPDPIASLREEMEALHRENRELRQRLESLMLWIQEREMLLETESLKDSGTATLGVEEPSPASERGGFLQEEPGGQVAGPAEAPQLTRTPYGHRRHAVVRRWRPPVLNGRR